MALGRNVLVRSCPGRVTIRGRDPAFERVVKGHVHLDHIEDTSPKRERPSSGRKRSPTFRTSRRRAANLDSAASCTSAPEVQQGDILWQDQPKGRPSSREERLLRAISVRSARVRRLEPASTHGECGIVVDVKFSQGETRTSLGGHPTRWSRLPRPEAKDLAGDKMPAATETRVVARIMPAEDMPYLPDGTP